MAAAPESDSSPANSPARSWRWCPPRSRIPLDGFASPASVRATGPALGVPEARP
jgi:hypothetical protein